MFFGISSDMNCEILLIVVCLHGTNLNKFIGSITLSAICYFFSAKDPDSSRKLQVDTVAERVSDADCERGLWRRLRVLLASTASSTYKNTLNSKSTVLMHVHI